MGLCKTKPTTARRHRSSWAKKRVAYQAKQFLIDNLYWQPASAGLAFRSHMALAYGDKDKGSTIYAGKTGRNNIGRRTGHDTPVSHRPYTPFPQILTR